MKSASKQQILLGNEAIARGLVEAGLHFITAYPGTPSSEILPSVVHFGTEISPPPYCEWSVNEKVALETALAAAYTGKRAACAMKQVGLNVALDPVMSAAYIGVIGGFIIISADDPGPHSSQTEQDSRLLAHFAKLPVFDPDSPAQARDLIAPAFALSEQYEIPVMLRPSLRVCHARQGLALKKPQALKRPAQFQRDPSRWAAIPKMRLALHHKLNAKLKSIASQVAADPLLNTWHRQPLSKKAPLGILAAGVAAALARDVLAELGLTVEDGPLPFLQTMVPYPLPLALVERLLDSCSRVLVLEETEPLLELLSPRRERLWGRYSGHVPSAGELTPDVLYGVLERALKQAKVKVPRPRGRVLAIPDQAPPRRPNLCTGCAHRTVFFAMRRVFPTGIYPGDIGCYTLGMNQGAVDTCHDMGASITFAAGLSRVYQMENRVQPVVATIGDSTFYHSGAPGLINAVHNGARFVLLIMNNETTSMTGMQPTPETGVTADGHPGRRVDLLELVRGCGVSQIEQADPYDLPEFLKVLRRAKRYADKPDGGVAVIIARHACVAKDRGLAVPQVIPVQVLAPTKATPPVFLPQVKACADCVSCVAICPTGALKRTGKASVKVDKKKCTSCRLCASVCPTGTMVLEPARGCTACGLCSTWFACPALARAADGHVSIDRAWCVDCGLCLYVCAQKAIVQSSPTANNAQPT
ncbi:indolepyruvate ferredoxin oxidoreductase, alpha subunit [Desulfarculales bacterium]